jgi:hypothetical protein
MSTFALRDDPDYQRFVKAKDEGYPVFILIAPDATASLTVDFWEQANIMARSFMETGLSQDQAVKATRAYYRIPEYRPGLEDAKLDGAAKIARNMDVWLGNKKMPD